MVRPLEEACQQQQPSSKRWPQGQRPPAAAVARRQTEEHRWRKEGYNYECKLQVVQLKHKNTKCIRVKLSVPCLVLRLIFGLKNILKMFLC